MAKRNAQFWSAIVVEAETAGVPHTQIAAKHGVSLPALKYHIYKARNAGAKAEPRLLPVRMTDERRTFQVELGAVRLNFAEGCEPAYVAAVLSAVGKTC
jgi:hypothetical protein